MSQLQERYILQLVLTEGLLKQSVVVWFRCRQKSNLVFSWYREKKEPGCLPGQESWKHWRQIPVYLHQNKASPCCKWRSGYAAGRQLLKSSDSDLWMARGNLILKCRFALVFMKVLFSCPEDLWRLMSKVAALAVILAELSGWKNEEGKIKIRYLIRGKSRENSSCAGKALRD